MEMTFHFVRKYPLSCILFAAIWYLSLFFMTPETPLNNIKLIDKWIHFIMYGGTCSVLWIEYIRQHQKPDYRKLFIWAWVAPIVMSGIIEVLQEYCTETRNGDWLDLTANAIGVTLGAVFGLILLVTKKKK